MLEGEGEKRSTEKGVSQRYRVEYVHPPTGCENSGKKEKGTELTSTYAKALQLAELAAPTCKIQGCGAKYTTNLIAKK